MVYSEEDGLIRQGTNPGRSVVIRPDPASLTTPGSLALVNAMPGDPVGKASLLNVDCSDEKSEVVSVTLDNPDPFDTATIAGMARPFALVEWGVAGIQSLVEVDFEHGLSFSVPGAYLRVTGVNAPIPAKVADVLGLGVPAFGRNIRLGAFCGYGSVSRAGNFNGKRTIYIDSPTQLDTFIKIPPFATNFTAYQLGAPPAVPVPFSVEVMDEQGNIITIAVFSSTSSAVQPVELSGDAAFIFLRTPPAPTFNSLRIIFGLSI